MPVSSGIRDISPTREQRENPAIQQPSGSIRDFDRHHRVHAADKRPESTQPPDHEITSASREQNLKELQRQRKELTQEENDLRKTVKDTAAKILNLQTHINYYIDEDLHTETPEAVTTKLGEYKEDYSIENPISYRGNHIMENLLKSEENRFTVKDADDMISYYSSKKELLEAREVTIKNQQQILEKKSKREAEYTKSLAEHGDEHKDKHNEILQDLRLMEERTKIHLISINEKISNYDIDIANGIEKMQFHLENLNSKTQDSVALYGITTDRRHKGRIKVAHPGKMFPELETLTDDISRINSQIKALEQMSPQNLSVPVSQPDTVAQETSSTSKPEVPSIARLTIKDAQARIEPARGSSGTRTDNPADQSKMEIPRPGGETRASSSGEGVSAKPRWNDLVDRSTKAKALETNFIKNGFRGIIQVDETKSEEIIQTLRKGDLDKYRVFLSKAQSICSFSLFIDGINDLLTPNENHTIYSEFSAQRGNTAVEEYVEHDNTEPLNEIVDFLKTTQERISREINE